MALLSRDAAGAHCHGAGGAAGALPLRVALQCGGGGGGAHGGKAICAPRFCPMAGDAPLIVSGSTVDQLGVEYAADMTPVWAWA